MENRDWLAELRGRAFLHITKQKIIDVNTSGEVLDRIMADVEVFGVLKAREGWEELRVAAGLSDTTYGPAPVKSAARLFPLPMRTRKVLREEPVPGSDGPLYRWKGNMLQCNHDTRAWEPAHTISPSDAALMRHALDLHDNPYRTEEVPADENNPWPEVEP